MKNRMNYYPQFGDAFAKLADLGKLVKESSLGKQLVHLIDLRVSQINGCTFCIDMHVKEAKIDGEKELRLHHLAGWKESPLFTDKEKAAFLWAETLTLVSQNHVPDEIYAQVKEHFSDKELVELTMAVTAINTWNRFAIAFRSVPGSLDKMYGLEKAGL